MSMFGVKYNRGDYMQIYKVTNIVDNKTYVGKTKNGIESRKLKHISSLNTKSKKHYKLYEAIKEHGISNFEWEVIDSAVTDAELNEKEMKWIKQLNTIFPNGYNLNQGGLGNKGYKHSKESIEKISRNNYWLGRPGVNVGKKFSEEHRRKLSEAKIGKPNNIVYTEEVIKKLSEQKLGDKNPMYGKVPPTSKKVVNVDTGEIFDSIKSAERENGAKASNIQKVCVGLRKTANGVRWAFLTDYMTIPCQDSKE